MKNLTLAQMSTVYSEYVMTDEEMIRIKGGGDPPAEPIVVPTPPRPKI